MFTSALAVDRLAVETAPRREKKTTDGGGTERLERRQFELEHTGESSEEDEKHEENQDR